MKQLREVEKREPIKQRIANHKDMLIDVAFWSSLVFILNVVFFMPILCEGANTKSNGAGGGVWPSNSSWNVNAPICNDTIIIKASDQVDIEDVQQYDVCAEAMYVEVNGILDFSVTGAKLKLPTGSVVVVNEGGLIKSSPGNNSNKIFIGSSVVWDNKDGDVNGFACLGCALLPIELEKFDAKIVESNVIISWTTLTETNNDYFTIEKSTDGVSYKEIMQATGSGNSNETRNYETIDNQLLVGRSYYRLKQTDFNGKYTYSKVASINNLPVVDDLIRLLSNPVKENGIIQLLLAHGNYDINVFDINGRLMFNEKITTGNDGQALYTLSNRLHRGMYIIRLRMNQRQYVRKLSVQ